MKLTPGPPFLDATKDHRRLPWEREWFPSPIAPLLPDPVRQPQHNLLVLLSWIGPLELR